MKKKSSIVLLLVLCMVLVVSACGSKQTQTDQNESANNSGQQEGNQEQEAALDYPTKSLEVVIAFGPGGGNDRMSRLLADILQKYDLYPHPIVPENREGGSGAVGWGYVNSQSGNPHVLSTTSGSFITTPLVSDPGFNYESFTPVALLATDDVMYLVSGDSPYQTMEEFIEAAKTKRMTVGGMGAFNVDRIDVELLEKETNSQLEYVPFNNDGEVNSSLLSGSLDAIVSNPQQVLGQVEAGTMRALAYSSTERMKALPDLPTLHELGLTYEISMPRGIILPPDVPEEVQEWWIDTIKQVVETPEWKEYIEANNLAENLLYGAEFFEYLIDVNNNFETVLKDVGVIQ